MAERESLKVGDKMPVEKFYVSQLNVRAGEAFGESEEDNNLINQLRRGEIVEAFTGRPEDKEGRWTPSRDLSEAVGYGVVVGRRRCLGKKAAGAKVFVVGDDCLIKEMSDEEAREASWIENWNLLRADMNPITRARGLARMMAFSTRTLRGWARRWHVSPSTLSEYLKVLELSPKMQEALAKGMLYYTDALLIARMRLGTDLQDKLAEVLETEGLDEFKRELMRASKGKMKRGHPKGAYIILRTTFDKRYKPDMELYEKLTELAEAKNRELSEYCKWVFTEHVKSCIVDDQS